MKVYRGIKDAVKAMQAMDGLRKRQTDDAALIDDSIWRNEVRKTLNDQVTSTLSIYDLEPPNEALKEIADKVAKFDLELGGAGVLISAGLSGYSERRGGRRGIPERFRQAGGAYGDAERALADL